MTGVGEPSGPTLKIVTEVVITSFPYEVGVPPEEGLGIEGQPAVAPLGKRSGGIKGKPAVVPVADGPATGTVHVLSTTVGRPSVPRIVKLVQVVVCCAPAGVLKSGDSGIPEMTLVGKGREF